jgi:hypothetical protein
LARTGCEQHKSHNHISTGISNNTLGGNVPAG